MQGDKPPVRTFAPVQAAAQKSAAKPAFSGSRNPLASFVSVPQRRAGAPALSEFKPGVKVRHTRFGNGVVRDIAGEGDGMTASIEFDGLGIKRFALAIAVNSLSIVKE